MKMSFRSIISFFACCLIASAAASSRQALDERLRDFNVFWTERMKEINGAAIATKGAVHSTTVELQELLTMVVDELKTMDDETQSLKKENQVLLDSKAGLIDTVKTMNNENQSLRKENQDLVDSKAGLIDTVKTMKNTIAGMTDDIHDLKDALKKQKETAEAQANCIEEKDKLQNEIKNLKKEREDHAAAIGSKEEIIRGMKNKIDSLTKRIKDLVEQDISLAEDLAAAKTKIQELQETIGRMKIEIEISHGGYEMVSGRYVKFYNEELSWIDAFNTCQNFSSRLITVEDDATTKWIVDRHVPIWIGATDAMQEGNWTWIDSGKEIVDGNWNPGEPNNGMHMFNENCAAANFQTFLWWSLGKWSDRSCSKQVRFACEIPDPSLEKRDVEERVFDLEGLESEEEDSILS